MSWTRGGELQFSQLIDGVREYAINLLDREGRITTWNSGAERIKGYRAEEILGRHFCTFYTKDAVAAGWPAYELKVATETRRFEDEGWRVRKDGSVFWANVVITAVYEQGRLHGFLKITRDLTDRRQAEETEWASDIVFAHRTIWWIWIRPCCGMEWPPSPVWMCCGFWDASVGSRRNVSTVGFRGVVKSRLMTGPEGVRIKHLVNANSIKMSNKEGSVLRIETTIHNARDMKVHRASECDPQGEKSWRILRKGIADPPPRDFRRRQSAVFQGAGRGRLSGAAEPDSRRHPGSRTRWRTRMRSLRPLTGTDARLATILLRGEFAITGFRNRAVRRLLFPHAQPRLEQRRPSNSAAPRDR